MASRPWTREEDRRLLELRGQDFSSDEIAKNLDRTESAVMARYYKVIPHPTRHPAKDIIEDLYDSIQINGIDMNDIKTQDMIKQLEKILNIGLTTLNRVNLLNVLFIINAINPNDEIYPTRREFETFEHLSYQEMINLIRGYLNIPGVKYSTTSIRDAIIQNNPVDLLNFIRNGYPIEGNNLIQFTLYNLRKDTERSDIDEDRTLDIFSILVDNGVDVNERGRLGWTPLHYAMILPDPDLLVLRLLELGADPNIKDINGMTPFNIAVEKRNQDLIILLYTYGADINTRDRNGDTPLIILYLLTAPFSIEEKLGPHALEISDIEKSIKLLKDRANDYDIEATDASLNPERSEEYAILEEEIKEIDREIGRLRNNSERLQEEDKRIMQEEFVKNKDILDFLLLLGADPRFDLGSVLDEYERTKRKISVAQVERLFNNFTTDMGLYPKYSEFYFTLLCKCIYNVKRLGHYIYNYNTIVEEMKNAYKDSNKYTENISLDILTNGITDRTSKYIDAPIVRFIAAPLEAPGILDFFTYESPERFTFRGIPRAGVMERAPDETEGAYDILMSRVTAGGDIDVAQYVAQYLTSLD